MKTEYMHLFILLVFALSGAVLVGLTSYFVLTGLFRTQTINRHWFTAVLFYIWMVSSVLFGGYLGVQGFVVMAKEAEKYHPHHHSR